MKRVAIVAVFTLAGCFPDLPLSLGTQCDLDSDCETPLICGWGRCRTECTTSRDCALGIDCIFDNRQRGVCQLTEETRCTFDSECPGDLVCTFGECTNPCDGCADETPCRNCPAGASCVARDDGTQGCLDPATQACTHNSNCDARNDTFVCAGDQRCRAACRSDVDCRLGDVCATTRVVDDTDVVEGTFCVGPGVMTPVDGGVPDGGADDGG